MIPAVRYEGVKIDSEKLKKVECKSQWIRVLKPELRDREQNSNHHLEAERLGQILDQPLLKQLLLLLIEFWACLEQKLRSKILMLR